MFIYGGKTLDLEAVVVLVDTTGLKVHSLSIFVFIIIL